MRCHGGFFFNDTATTEIYTLSLHDALPICTRAGTARRRDPAPPRRPASAPAPGGRASIDRDVLDHGRRLLAALHAVDPPVEQRAQGEQQLAQRARQALRQLRRDEMPGVLEQ